MRRSLAIAALLLAAACGEASGPTPELRADVATLRRTMRSDPAVSPIAEVERIADGRPVHGAEKLTAEAIPAARAQVERVAEAEMSTEQGRAFARKLRDAYAARVRGLELWQGYLEDAATDDVALLEATSAMREASVALVEIDREMDSVTPVAPRR